MAAQSVTVFGGTGFLGRHIVRHLQAAGFGVRAASRHPDRGRRGLRLLGSSRFAPTSVTRARSPRLSPVPLRWSTQSASTLSAGEKHFNPCTSKPPPEWRRSPPAPE
jgi:nucleoside-diphosphate-sugar epimerase